jgi:hypothetical protein
MNLYKLVTIAGLLGTTAGCARGPTPESACRELEREKLVTDCKEGSTVNTESLPGTQWHFKLPHATVENDGVILRFGSAAEMDSAYEAVLRSDARMHSLQAGFDQLQKKAASGDNMKAVLPWRFAIDKPWTLVMMPSLAGDGEPVLHALKSIYLRDGAGMRSLFYSGTEPMTMPVE